MSRVTTSPLTQPAKAPHSQIPHEKIALRAYDKWVKRGRLSGTDTLDWIEAEAELKSEMMRTTPSKR